MVSCEMRGKTMSSCFFLGKKLNDAKSQKVMGSKGERLADLTSRMTNTKHNSSIHQLDNLPNSAREDLVDWTSPRRLFGEET